MPAQSHSGKGEEIMEQIWAQDSKVKGLRIIRFEPVADRKGYLRWLGPLNGEQEYDMYGQKVESSSGWLYGEQELVEHGWERIE